MDSNRSPVWTVLLTSSAFFMAALDLLVVVTALPAIHHDLHASPALLEWTVNAYSLATAGGIVTAAALGDRFGRRRLFAIGLALFTASSSACALAPSIEWVIAARVLQGAGAALIAPLSLTLLTAAFPPQRRGAVVGVWGGLAGLAIAAGPLVGGLVTQYLTWHWIFWINLPVGVAAMLFSLRKLAESHGPSTSLDFPAMGLVTGGATALVWGLTEAGGHGATYLPAFCGLLVGVTLLTGFLIWEWTAKEPMLPLRLFRSRGFAAANLTAFFMNAALLGGAFLISQYLQFGLRYSALAAGLHFLPMTATPILVAPLAGILSDRVGPRPVMVAGMVLLTLGLGWIALAAGPDTPYASLVLPLVIAGAGVSMPFATAATAALSAVSPLDLGKASGTTNTVQRFGGAFGLAVATAVFSSTGQLGSAEAFARGFRPGELAATVLALAGAAAAVWVAGKRRAARGTNAEAVPATAVAG